MKLSFVEMSGFRGYCDPIRIDFGSEATIIDGRNGVGKSSIFDAIEFALTGSIAKYQDAKANQETVDDYIWWLGDNDGPEERYVTVGFILDGVETMVRRTSLRPDVAENIDIIANSLVDELAAPVAAMQQICSSTIIRDEHIAALSLDLKETERYSILSSAIGATGADEWIAKAKEIHDAAKKSLSSAVAMSEQAKSEATRAQIELDGRRARAQNDQRLSSALAEVEGLLSRRVPADEAASVVSKELEKARFRMTQIRSCLEAFQELESIAAVKKEDEGALREGSDELKVLAELITAKTQELSDFDLTASSDILASQLSRLASLGEEVGCADDTCPLCRSKINADQFRTGIEALKESADAINSDISRATRLKNEISEAGLMEKIQTQKQERLQLRLVDYNTRIRRATQLIEENGLVPGASHAALTEDLERLNERSRALGTLLPELNMSGRSTSLERASIQFEEKRFVDREAERALSKAKQREADAKELYDAVRKAANDALNQRLDRILPLITELYARLRPNPNFQEISYKLRGELRRHLSFSVGDDINPQFVYSSGQRRATGLAFLIAVNLSMAWSRWASVLLDDPVQHIDDFRSVHLSELLGQLVREGRQVICAVEDPALADLLCRKMPVTSSGAARRITLGVSDTGRVKVMEQRDLSPMPAQVLLDSSSDLAV